MTPDHGLAFFHKLEIDDFEQNQSWRFVAAAGMWEAPSHSQRHAFRTGPVIRGALSPSRAWRSASVARLARTLAATNAHHRHHLPIP